MRRFANQVFSIQTDAAICWTVYAREHIKYRCLARSVRPEQPHDFSLRHFRRHAANDFALAVPFVQIDAGEERHQRFPFREPVKTASTRFLDPPITSLRFSWV